MSQTVTGQKGQPHLKGGAAQGDSFDGLQAFQGKLQPQREEEKGHADLRELFHLVDFRDRNPPRKGTHRDTRQNIPYNERLVEPASPKSSEKPCDNDDNEICGDTHRISLFSENGTDVSRFFPGENAAMNRKRLKRSFRKTSIMLLRLFCRGIRGLRKVESILFCYIRKWMDFFVLSDLEFL